MTLLLILIFAALGAVAVGAVYLLGFRLGGQHWLAELERVRADALDARRRTHALTVEAFSRMAEAATQRRTGWRE